MPAHTSIDLVWDDARIFLGVAREGSISHAARRLGIGIATVSRRIERLEHVLGAPLFLRHQTGYKLTDDGHALVERAEAIETAIHAFTARGQSGKEISGHVKLATAEKLASDIIIPALPNFFKAHPNLTIDIVTHIQTANLHRRDADIAVRMVRPSHGNLIINKVGRIGYGVYASPDYLGAKFGPDKALMDEIDFIAWSETYSHLAAAQWVARALKGRRPAMSVTTLDAKLVAARAGVGAALIPHFLAKEAGLSAVEFTHSPKAPDVDQDIWLVIHGDLASSMRVRTFADFLQELFRANAQRLEHGK